LSNRSLRILKIGGAVITDKTKGVTNRAKMEEIRRIAEEISRIPDRLILVHGVGSFGHPHVEKYDLLHRVHPLGLAETHASCRELNLMICRELMARGVPAISVSPFNAFSIENDRFTVPLELIQQLVDNGMVPVLHGDMVAGDGQYRVISGDKIVEMLANGLGADRVGFATDTPLLIEDKVMDELSREELQKILDKIGDAGNKSDVTGGMRGKLEAILRIGCEVAVFQANPGAIEKFLRGERVGTIIR
jgi:isopentenyl phosphate kinase